MKKKTIKIETITLDKETVARLDENQIDKLVGGAEYVGSMSCRADIEELVVGSCCLHTCNTGDIN